MRLVFLVNSAIRDLFFSWAMSAINTLALPLAYLSLAGCKLFRTTIEDDEGTEMGIQFGIFYQLDDNGACEPWKENIESMVEGDVLWDMAKAVSSLSVAAVGVAWLLLLTMLFCWSKPRYAFWYILKALYIVAVLSHFLVAVVFGSELCQDGDCRLGNTGGAAITNGFLLVILNILVWSVPPPHKALFGCLMRDDFGGRKGIHMAGSTDDEDWESKTAHTSQPPSPNRSNITARGVMHDEKDLGDRNITLEDIIGDGQESVFTADASVPYDERRSLSSGLSNQSSTAVSRVLSITTETTPHGEKTTTIIGHPDGTKTIETKIDIVTASKD